MSKTNNVLTKYFGKSKKNISNEPTTELTVTGDEQENESPCSKRLKLSESKSLPTSPICYRASASLTISTYSSSSTTTTCSLPSATTSSLTTTPSSATTSSTPPTPYLTSTTCSLPSACPATSSSIYPTSPTCSRALASLTISTPSPPPSATPSSPTSSISPTCLTSSNERDPCGGPEMARKFIFLGPYQPGSKFPTVDHRHFCRQWYSIYSWLEYSTTCDRAFCFVCRLSYGAGKSDISFTVTGFNTWKNATTRFDRHQSSIIHKEALQTWEDMKKNYSNNTDVLKLLDKQHMKQAAENRAYLSEIMRTIVFLGKQGIAFRGHREHDESSNRGNFLELLELRSLDNELIKNNLHKLKFTDHKIQNEIIELLQQQILTGVLNECRRAKYFSVMIDETKDTACHEQVSLVIRYVDEKFNVYEKFIGFERTAKMTGEALAELLIQWLNKLDLKLKHLVGQCYDGASNMRGEYQGVAARLRELAPLGIYVHCNAHVLNLCLIDVSARVPSVRNTFGVVLSLYNLIEGSAKRHLIFEHIQKEAGLKQLTIKKLSETRWTCRLECLKVILLRYNEIIMTLENMEEPDAFLLLNSIRTFDFGSNISLTDALGQVNITIDTLKSLRNETEFERLYNEALKLCDENGIEPCTKVRQKKIPARLGGGVDIRTTLKVKDYYRVNSYYVILDTIITSINNKFHENNIRIVVLMEKLFLSKELLNEIELQELAQNYSISYDDLKAEQRLYKTKMIGQKVNLSEATKFILENNFHVALSSMNELFKILWTIPVNSCECERSFSSLRRLKTYLRNTMGQERLSGLALLNIEKDFEINMDQLVRDFIANKKTRKLIF